MTADFAKIQLVSLRQRSVAQRADVVADGGGGSGFVAGGEEVEKGAAEDCQGEGASGRGVGGVAFAGWLESGEEGQPFVDGGASEA